MRFTVLSLLLLAGVAQAQKIQILAFGDNACLGPAVANVSTAYDTCTAVNGMGMVQVNSQPAYPSQNCAFMTGFGDSDCTRKMGNMFSLNSQCGACQGATYGVTCKTNSAASVSIATYCLDNACDCNTNTFVPSSNCTWVPDLGYVILDHIAECKAISYTLYYSADYCDDEESQILPFAVPNGQCNSGLRITLLD